MLKSQSLLLSIAGVVVLAVAACQPSDSVSASAGTPSPASDSVVAESPTFDLATAREMNQQTNISRLYTENCANCHGERGEGGGAGTNTVLTAEQFDQKYDKPFFDAIKNGVKDMGMSAYGQTMTDEQIWGLVVHMRELQARALRAEKGSPKATNGVYTSKHVKYRVETVVDTDQGLKTPWAIDWLPNGTMLVTNRPGTLSVVKEGKVVGRVSGIPESREQGQGGLMEVSVHPQYASNGWIYLGYSEPGPDGRGAMTTISRGKLTWSGNDANWTQNQVLFRAKDDEFTGAGVHFGNRIVFDGKGHVFFSIGDRGQQDRAQDVSRPNGKVFRINEDGTVPSDNPFVNRAGALKQVWSYGHRNPQALTFDAEGNLWDTEHGPRGGDELNMVKKGANYGWPLVAFSINYNDSPFQTPWPKAGQDIAMPAFRWLPSIGACGMDTVRGAAFPEWKGDLMAGGLAGQNVDRFRVKGGVMVEREEIIHGMGRVREVATGPDGMIYVALNQPDKIVRVSPAR